MSPEKIASRAVVLLMKMLKKENAKGEKLVLDFNLITVPEPSLVGWWRLDEVEGNQIPDKSGKGHTGEITGAKHVSGSGMQFAATDECVLVAHSPDFDMIDELTVEAWIFINEFSNNEWWHNQIIGKDMNIKFCVHWAEHKLHILSLVEGVWYYDYGHTELLPKTWYHVAYTYDGKETKIYINGKIDNIIYHPGKLTAFDKPLLIGKNPGGASFNGIIREVKIYNRALTEDELSGNYELSGFK